MAEGSISYCPDVADAVGCLTPPGKPEEFVDPMKLLNDVSDFASPSYWLNEVLKATINVNPLEEVSKWVAGDWEGFAHCADAFEALGRFMGAVAANLDAGSNIASFSWRGNAADAADVYFKALSEAVGHQRETLHELHEQYMSAAKGVWEFAKMANDVLKEILDIAIVAGIEIAVGAILSETMAGTAICWALAGERCVKIVIEWNRLVKEFNHLQDFVYLVHGNLLKVVSDASSFKRFPLPAQGYQHPAVSGGLCRG